MKHCVQSHLMRGASQEVDNWSNFETYKLRRPVGLIRADAHRSPFRGNLAEVSALCTPHGSGAGAMSFACTCVTYSCLLHRSAIASERSELPA